MTKTKALRDGDDLRDARLALGLDLHDFGVALGLSGARKSIQVRMSQYERGHVAPPSRMLLLAECLLQGARPSSYPEKSAG